MWRFIDFTVTNPYLNMAYEEVFLHTVGQGASVPVLRFWQNWNTVVIGYFQKLEQEVDVSECKALYTQVVRRLSGGGAVYHDWGNLNYAIFLPNNYPGLPDDLTESYRWLSMGIVKGLEALGLKAEFAPLNDLLIGGKKVSGVAQTRRYGAILHHGTLLLNTNLEYLTRTLRVMHSKLSKHNLDSIRQRVTNLKDLGVNLSLAEIKQVLIKGFNDWFKVEIIKSPVTPLEHRLARNLFFEKYNSREWNYKR